MVIASSENTTAIVCIIDLKFDEFDGVPIRSVVGALDHHGRILDVLTLPTLEWKVADAPREQFPCSRGTCYLPSLEVFHAYRVGTEDTGAVQTLLNLPAYEPSKHRDLRAPRGLEYTWKCCTVNSRDAT